MPGKLTASRGLKAIDKKIYLPAAVILLLLLGILVSAGIRTQTIIKATTHQPETYTELYFTHPNSLEGIAKVGQSVEVSFTIHNVEARNMTYTTDTELTYPSGQTAIVSQHQIALINGETHSYTVNALMPRTPGRYEVSIVLVHQPETIHYYVEVST